jgi:hypothetical protein
MAENIIAVRVELSGVTEESRDIQRLNEEIEKLTEQRKRYNEAVKSGKGDTEAARIELAKTEQSVRDLNESKKKLVQTETQSAKTFKASKGSMEELRAQTAQLRAEANRLNLTTEAGQKRFKDLEGQIKNNTGKIRDFDRGLSGSSTLVGEYGLGIKKAFMAIGASIGAVMIAWKFFKDTIESTDTSADQFARVMEGATNAYDYFKKSLATGDFTNFFSNMEKAIKLGADYADQLDEIGNRRRSLTIDEAEANVFIQQQQKILKDQLSTNEERIAAADKIINKEKELATLRKSIADQAIKARIDDYGALGINEEILKSNLKNFETNKDLIKQADEYNQRVADLKALYTAANSVNAYGSTSTLAETKAEKEQYEKLRSEINGTSGDVKQFAEMRSKYTKLNEKELDELVQLYVDSFNAQASFDENTQKAAARRSALLAKEGDAVDKTSEKRAAATKKEKEETEKLVQADRELLKVYFGLKTEPETAFKPTAISGLLKSTASANAPGLTTGHVQQGGGVETKLSFWDSVFPEIPSDDINKGLQEAAALANQAVDSIFNYRIAANNKAMNEELKKAEGNEAKTNEIKAKYAKKNQRIAIGQAIIGGAQGVLRAFSDYMFPLSLIIAALTAVAVGVQIATIKKQTFARGGRITGTGNVAPDANGDNTLILAKPGEVILNNRQQQALGGARTFRSLGVPGFAEGGMVGPSSVSMPTVMTDLSQLAQVMANSINDKKVTLVLSELDAAQGTLDVIKQPGKF